MARNYETTHTPYTCCVFFPFRKRCMYFHMLRNSKEFERKKKHSRVSPKILSFPSIQERAVDKHCIDSMQFLCILLSFSLGYSHQHWAKWTCHLSENVIFLVTCTQRAAAQPLNLPLHTHTGSSFPNRSRRSICALKNQVTFLILAWIPCSIMNDLNYTALSTHRFMNTKYSD